MSTTRTKREFYYSQRQYLGGTLFIPSEEVRIPEEPKSIPPRNLVQEYYDTAEQFVTQGKYDIALDWYKLAIGEALSGHTKFRIYTHYAMALNLANRFDEAISVLRWLYYDANLRDGDVCFNLGCAYEGLEDYQLALHYYQEAVTDSRYSDAYICIERVQKLIEVGKEATQVQNEKENNNTENVNSGPFDVEESDHTRYADTSSSDSDTEEKIDPTKERIDELYIKANASREQGHSQKEIKILNEILELDPTDSIAWNNKAAAWNKLGKYRDAEICAEKAIKLDKTNNACDEEKAKPWRHCGDAAAGLERYSEALGCYNKARQLNPNYPGLRKDIEKCENKCREIQIQTAIAGHIKYRINDYINKTKKKLETFTIAGFTLFYNKELSDKKIRLAEDILRDLGNRQSYVDAKILLYAYLYKDKELAANKKYEKSPATFTALLTELLVDIDNIYHGRPMTASSLKNRL